MKDQKSCIENSIDLIARTIYLAITNERPVLASQQIFDKIFKKYKDQATNAERLKYEQKLADLMESEAKKKE